MIERVAAFCARRPWLVIALAFLIAAAGVFVTVTRFAINTNTATLISASLPWRKDLAAYDAAFPQRLDLIVAVIEAGRPRSRTKPPRSSHARSPTAGTCCGRCGARTPVRSSSERAPVPVWRRARPHDRTAHPAAGVPRSARRRPEPARPDERAVARAAGRAQRRDHARRAVGAAWDDRRDPRAGAGRRAGAAVLAPAPVGRGARAARAQAPRPGPAEPRLRGARAGRRGDPRRARRGRGPRADPGERGAGAAHRFRAA